MQLLCAKTAEQIEVLVVAKTPGHPRHILLDERPSPPTAKGRRSG